MILHIDIVEVENMQFELTQDQKEHLLSILPDAKPGHEFSYHLCCKLLRNDYSLIDDFYTDGENDRGIDFVYVRVNNKTSSFDKAINLLKENAVNSIKISLFQCKNTKKEISSVSENEFIKIGSFLDTVKRYTQNCEEVTTSIFNKRLHRFVMLLKCIYDNIHYLNDINFEYNYINTVLEFDEFQNKKIKNDMGVNIENKLLDIFNKAKFTFELYSRVNLKNLYNLYSGYKRQLFDVHDCINDDEGLIAKVHVKEFFKCITCSDVYDIKSFIENYDDFIFDNNVRSFQGKNSTNNAIIKTCENLALNAQHRRSVGFWVKNNGITILCENYLINSNGVLDIYDLKIINGLQTISSIHEFLKQNPDLTMKQLDFIKVQIKVIKKEGLSKKEIEEIIIATNSQTQVKYLDLISIDDDLERLEFKLYDHNIDYERKKKQKSKTNCTITIKHNELLQLIITCFGDGPSAAKNKLKSSLYAAKNENGEKVLISFREYWNSNKFETLKRAIILYDSLKTLEKKNKENQVLKYAKLHTTFCAINIIPAHLSDSELLDKSITIMKNVFDYYGVQRNTTIEQMSKNISSERIRLIVNTHDLCDVQNKSKG